MCWNPRRTPRLLIMHNDINNRNCHPPIIVLSRSRYYPDWLLTDWRAHGLLHGGCCQHSWRPLFRSSRFELQLPWLGLSAVCHGWNMGSCETDRSCHFQNWQAGIPRPVSSHPKQSDTRSDPVSSRRNGARAHTLTCLNPECDADWHQQPQTGGAARLTNIPSACGPCCLTSVCLGFSLEPNVGRVCFESDADAARGNDGWCPSI